MPSNKLNRASIRTNSRAIKQGKADYRLLVGGIFNAYRLNTISTNDLLYTILFRVYKCGLEASTLEGIMPSGAKPYSIGLICK